VTINLHRLVLSIAVGLIWLVLAITGPTVPGAPSDGELISFWLLFCFSILLLALAFGMKGREN